MQYNKLIANNNLNPNHFLTRKEAQLNDQFLTAHNFTELVDNDKGWLKKTWDKVTEFFSESK